MYHNQNKSQTEQTGCDLLISTSLHILDQLAVAVGDMTQDQYADSLEEGASSVGAHARHVIEFYQALFSILHANDKAELCYDQRPRNLLLETSKDAALQEISKIKVHLSAVPTDNLDINLRSIVDPDAPMLSIRTTLQRELFYLLDHTVHHMALIKMIAANHGFMCDQNFGLAQSTKAYENSRS